jgi:hypothetical protein
MKKHVERNVRLCIGNDGVNDSDIRNERKNVVKSKGKKVKLSLCLIKHHAMNTY